MSIFILSNNNWALYLDSLIHFYEHLLWIYEAVDLLPVFNFLCSGKIVFQNRVEFSLVK